MDIQQVCCAILVAFSLVPASTLLKHLWPEACILWQNGSTIPPAKESDNYINMIYTKTRVLIS